MIMKAHSWAMSIAAMLFWVGALAQRSPIIPRLRTPACLALRREAPSISPKSIGPLRLDGALGRLRGLCDTATDTVVRPSNTSISYRGLAFHFQDLTVVGLQYGGSVLDLGRMADGWIVMGTRATILGKVPLSASWAVLHAALGRAQVNARRVLAVRFCSFPNAIFTLNADPAAVATSGGFVDLSSVPSDATIHHVFIMSEGLATHLRGC